MGRETSPFNYAFCGVNGAEITASLPRDLAPFDRSKDAILVATC